MTEPLSVLFLIDGLWVGGTERSVAELLPALESYGVLATVACLRQRAEGVEDEVSPERVHWLQGPGLGTQVRSFRSLVRRLEPRIVHSALYRSNLVSRLGGAGLSTLIVNSLVNTRYEPVRLADPFLPAWRLRFVQAVDAFTGLLLVDHFQAVSEAVSRAATRRLRFPPSRITVVHRGRDPARLGEPSVERRNRIRDAIGVGREVPVLVNVGRQDYQKGQEYLVRAMAIMSERRPDLRLLVAGREGPESERLASLALELGVSNRIDWLGHREDLPDILAASDIFVFPSRFEGFPGAVIEAMALGLPVVAFDIPAIRELVQPERNGLLAPFGDAGALAVAIERLLQDPEHARSLGGSGREAFLTSLTLDRSARELANLYRFLTRRSAGSPRTLREESGVPFRDR